MSQDPFDKPFFSLNKQFINYVNILLLSHGLRHLLLIFRVNTEEEVIIICHLIMIIITIVCTESRALTK